MIHLVKMLSTMQLWNFLQILVDISKFISLPREFQLLFSPLNQLCGIYCPGEFLTDVDTPVLKAAQIVVLTP